MEALSRSVSFLFEVIRPYGCDPVPLASFGRPAEMRFLVGDLYFMFLISSVRRSL